jgi:hypothetical protein
MKSIRHVAAIVGMVLMGIILSVRPGAAQVVPVGFWNPIMDEDQHERAAGPELGDYSGLPVSAMQRMRADTWDASILTLPEHQCQPHPSTYGFRGVGILRVWEDRDPQTQELVKINTLIQWQQQHREIWMDGRPHPPEYARHTWQGFSTGTFDGDTLVVKTDHLRPGWIRRNGLALSDRATMTDRFIVHGDLLTHVEMIEDPVYLTEPMVKTNGFQFVPNGSMQPYPCRSVSEVDRKPGIVPNHLMGNNPFLHEVADRYGLPFEVFRGGAEQALPEYMETIKALMAKMPKPATKK